MPLKIYWGPHPTCLGFLGAGMRLCGLVRLAGVPNESSQRSLPRPCGKVLLSFGENNFRLGR